jgi:arginine/ornithine N-succinyltransferase beta subunit
MSVRRDNIRTRREARRLRLEAAGGLEAAKRALIATPHIGGFRCVAARAEVLNGAARVDTSVLSALKLDAGAEALVWIDDAY